MPPKRKITPPPPQENTKIPKSPRRSASPQPGPRPDRRIQTNENTLIPNEDPFRITPRSKRSFNNMRVNQAKRLSSFAPNGSHASSESKSSADSSAENSPSSPTEEHATARPSLFDGLNTQGPKIAMAAAAAGAMVLIAATMSCDLDTKFAIGAVITGAMLAQKFYVPNPNQKPLEAGGTGATGSQENDPQSPSLS